MRSEMFWKRFLLGAGFCLALSGLVSSLNISMVKADDDSILQKDASWSWPDLRIIEEQLKSHLDLVQASPQQRIQAEQAWKRIREAPAGPQMLETLFASIPEFDATLSKHLSPLIQGSVDMASFDVAGLQQHAPAWLQDNVKLAIAQLYCQAAQFEDALVILDTINDAAVIDPSSLMFYRAICHHHFLDRDKCIEQIDRLLEREKEVVTRYVVTAKLMKDDMQPFKTGTLDEIARLMNDVERRLDLGRAGSQVREREKEVVEKLDKLIEKIEQEIQEQQQQQQQGNSKDQGSQQKGNPLNESRAAGGQGPGDVNPKKLDPNGSWGDLPPAQRQEALQNITRDLPSHYREVIEAYFKRLGTGEK